MESSPTSFYANLLVVSQALQRQYDLDTDAMLASVGAGSPLFFSQATL